MDGFETGPEVIDRMRLLLANADELIAALTRRAAKAEADLAMVRTVSAETERALEDRVEALVDLVHWLDRRCGLGLDARLRIAQVLKEGR